MEVVDYKPKNKNVVDIKPVNEVIFNAKPKNSNVNTGLTDQLYSMTLGRGMLIGLGPHITYPQNIDIISPKSP